MPKLQPYEGGIRSQGPVGGGGLSGKDLSFGQGLEKLGAGISDAAKGALEYKQTKDLFEAQKTAAQAELDWAERMNQMQRTAPPGAPEFTEKFKQDFDSWQSKAMENAPGGAARAHLEKEFGQIKLKYLKESMAFEGQAYAKKQSDDLTNIFSQSENAVRANPASRDDILDKDMKLIAATPFWNEQQKAQVIADRKAKVWDASLDGQVTTLETTPKVDVYTVDQKIKELKDEKSGWIKSSSSQAYDQGLTRLMKLREHLLEKKDREMFLDFEDRMKQIEVTGVDHGLFTESWIRQNVSDPYQREKMVKQQAASRAMGHAVVMTKDKPDTEVIGYIQSLESKLPGTGQFGKDYSEYTAAKNAFAHRIQAWKDDSVSYTLQVSSVASKKYDELTKNPGDPKVAADYADTILTEQKRLSPGSAPRLLSDAQVGQVAAQLSAVNRDGKGAEEALATLQAQQQLWGKNWPIAARDLRAGKALDDSQYVVASMLDKPYAKHIAEDLLRASVRKEEDLVKTIPDEGVAKKARESAIEALAPLRKTLMNNADGMEIYQAYENSLTKLMIYRSAMAGESKTAEASDLAEKMVMGSYEFTDTYRIPKDRNVSAVQDAVSEKLRGLSTQDFVLPTDLQGLGKEHSRERYLDNIKSFGRVVNMGDDSGLRMVDEHGRQVFIREGGKQVPLQWTWDELKPSPTSNIGPMYKTGGGTTAPF